MPDYCKWIYRPGTGNSHWAFTPCRPGFNPLTRISNSAPVDGCADWYNNRMCPICNKPIQMDYALVKEMAL